MTKFVIQEMVVNACCHRAYNIKGTEKLTENKIAILRLIAENPYISKSDLAKSIGISVATISSNIETMRNKYLRRVGPDKGGFWDTIE